MCRIVSAPSDQGWFGARLCCRGVRAPASSAVLGSPLCCPCACPAAPLGVKRCLLSQAFCREWVCFMSLLSGSLQPQAGSQMPTGKLLKTAAAAEGG